MKAAAPFAPSAPASGAGHGEADQVFQIEFVVVLLFAFDTEFKPDELLSRRSVSKSANEATAPRCRGVRSARSRAAPRRASEFVTSSGVPVRILREIGIERQHHTAVGAEKPVDPAWRE